MVMKSTVILCCIYNACSHGDQGLALSLNIVTSTNKPLAEPSDMFVNLLKMIANGFKYILHMSLN